MLRFLWWKLKLARVEVVGMGVRLSCRLPWLRVVPNIRKGMENCGAKEGGMKEGN
jgi:hypothetical protein